MAPWPRGVWLSDDNTCVLPDVRRGTPVVLPELWLKGEASTPAVWLLCPGPAQLSPVQLFLPSVSTPSPPSLQAPRGPDLPQRALLGYPSFPCLRMKEKSTQMRPHTRANVPDTPGSSRARRGHGCEHIAHACKLRLTGLLRTLSLAGGPDWYHSPEGLFRQL